MKLRLSHSRRVVSVSTRSPSPPQADERYRVQFSDLFAPEPFSPLLLALGDIDVTSHKLGEGFHSSVFLGRLQAPSKHAAWQRQRATSSDRSSNVAVKMLSTASGDSLEAEAAITAALLEARLHAHMAHPNLVRLLGVQETRRPLMLVLEYCAHGNLLQALRSRRHTGADFSAAQRRDMAVQAAAGLRYLHSKLVVHRDVAARNLLLASGSGPCGYTLKLADLGLSRQLKAESDYYRVRRAVRWACLPLLEAEAAWLASVLA